MPAKNAIKMRIFLRCLKLFSVAGVRKRPSIVFGLALTLLVASAAYYALKYNLTSNRPLYKMKYHPEANRQSIVHIFNSEEAFRSPERNEQQIPKHLYSEMGIPFIPINPRNPYIPKERIVHLDLKGAPPLKGYLQRIFPMIKNLGATGVLIEYEDMFPYSGSLNDITALNHYDRKDILEIISMAEGTGLKVIPLVQTFGHLEFALKRPSLVHLRENVDSPQALCPSMNASLVFIENMMSQVMELHRHRITHIHIGCDEVFHLGECKLCTNRTYDNDGGRSRDILFLTHVINIAKIVRRRWPEVRPIIWDDMLRHVSDDLLSLFDIGKYVDPVIWWYTEDVYRFIPTITWQKYSKVFKTAWTASAFKGAFGETLNTPNVRRHLENNLQWLKVMSEQTKYFENGFAGIMLTGWQRYDHFAVLCELLPASIPSLSLALVATSVGTVNATALYRFGSTLGCPETQPVSASRPPFSFNLDSDPYMWDALKNCIFPGSNFFKATSKLNTAETEAYEFIDQIKRHRGWLTDYNVRHKYSSGERVDGAVSGERDGGRTLRRLVYVAEYARAALQRVVDEHTAAEWIEQKPYPLILQLEQILADAVMLKSSRTWERRPLKPPADLSRFGQSLDDLFPI